MAAVRQGHTGFLIMVMLWVAATLYVLLAIAHMRQPPPPPPEHHVKFDVFSKSALKTLLEMKAVANATAQLAASSDGYSHAAAQTSSILRGMAVSQEKSIEQLKSWLLEIGSREKCGQGKRCPITLAVVPSLGGGIKLENVE